MTGALLGVLAATAWMLGSSDGARPARPHPGRGRATHRADWSTAMDALRGWAAPLLRGQTAARRDAQLPDLLERVASGLRAGLALGPALIAAAEGTPTPLADDLTPLVQALQHGAGVGSALERWASGPGTSEDVQLVAVALGLGAEAGGAVARAVDRVAATLRERRELQAEVRALDTQARTSASVLAAAPLLFAALVATIEPEAVAVLVTTPLGGVCLLLGLILESLGAAWMARIVRSAW